MNKSAHQINDSEARRDAERADAAGRHEEARRIRREIADREERRL